MTGLYDWNPMPHTLAVRCKGCGMCAEFEFAEIAKIQLRKDVEFFERSSMFDYEFLNSRSGSRWHAAIYYPGLHGGTAAIRDLPEGYDSSLWEHSRYLYRSPTTDRGSVKFSSCFKKEKSRLSWPGDAYYSIDYKNKILWAFNRESAVSLRDFIASEDRDESAYKWSSFLLHVPSIFKARGARSKIVRRLDELLYSS